MTKYIPHAIVVLLLAVILHDCNKKTSKDSGTTEVVKTDTVTVYKTRTVPGPVIKQYVHVPAPAAPKSSRKAPAAFIARNINTYVDTANFPGQKAKVIMRSEVQGVLLDKRVELQIQQDTIIKEVQTTVTTTITQKEKERIKLYATINGGLNNLGPGATITTPRNLLYQYNYNVLGTGFFRHQIGIGKVISFRKKK